MGRGCACMCRIADTLGRGQGHGDMVGVGSDRTPTFPIGTEHVLGKCHVLWLFDGEVGGGGVAGVGNVGI
jgi:hypothetical protein